MQFKKIVFIVLLVSRAVWAGADGPGWEFVTEKDGIRVWRRTKLDAKIQELKADGYIDAPVARVQDVLEHVEQYPEFMPYMTESKIVGQAAPDADYIYHKVDPPFVSKRDYTLRIAHHFEPQTGVYSRVWTTLPKDSPLGPPQQKNVIRLDLADGSWTVEPSGTNKSHVVYWVYAAPGGAMPSWLVNKANVISMPDVVRSLRKRSLDPTWKK